MSDKDIVKPSHLVSVKVGGEEYLFEEKIDVPSLLTLCLASLRSPEVDDILNRFGVEISDVNKKKLYPRDTDKDNK